MKVIMQGKVFQRCTHLLYCSVLYKTDVEACHGIHFSHKISMKYSGHRKLLCELTKFKALTSSDTKRTLMHIFLFTNSAQREIVSICAQILRNSN